MDNLTVLVHRIVYLCPLIYLIKKTQNLMVLFSEDHIQETRRRGRIEVICGSMFSGKTEELIRRMKRAKLRNNVSRYSNLLSTPVIQKKT